MSFSFTRIPDLRRPLIRAGLATILIAASAGLYSAGASAAGGVIDVPTPHPILRSNELLGEAQPDECFNGVGVDYPPINADGTCDVGTPKTNESYIWGLTEESNKLWFGTMANAACIISGQTLAAEGVDAAQRELICEYGESQNARTYPLLPDGVGDWRRPSIYSYDLATGELKNRRIQDPLLAHTLGFRGAGSINNIAFLGGSNVFSDTIDFFAFEADTGHFLGSCELAPYTYIRKWELADGVLYVGVGTRTAGAVLRWNGDLSSFDGNFCDDFQEVGHLTAWTANLTTYTDENGQDRLAATTAPIRSSVGVGVWVSPPLGADGLQPSDSDGWQIVWDPSVYEPDRIVGMFGYSGGAVQSFNGWLYWGTIHLPNVGAKRVHQSCTYQFCFGVPANQQEAQDLQTLTYRTASVWRGRNLENPDTREIQLLYGESELPACHSPHTYEMTSTGWTPLYGHSGFDNPRNEYIWQMATHAGHLFIGTYDPSWNTPEQGADLWRFDDNSSPAVNENFRGLGDTKNYGIRSMIELDDDSGIIAGMADPSNLSPGGGWELRRLKQTP